MSSSRGLAEKQVVEIISTLISALITGRPITKEINYLPPQNINNRSRYFGGNNMELHLKFFLNSLLCTEYDFPLPDVICTGKVTPTYNFGLSSKR